MQTTRSESSETISPGPEDSIKERHPDKESATLSKITIEWLCRSFQVWANEDTPLIWGQLIRELSGIDPTTPISGGFDLLTEIMSKPGMRRLRAYLKANPPQTELQKRRIMAAFLDKYAMEDAIEEELDLPGWTDDTVAYMTEQYEDDLFTIERMPGVNMITP